MLPPRIHLQSITRVLDFTGIAVGSIGGALHARQHLRYSYDIIGAFGLALTSALGGGVVRDILLQHGPPLALTEVGYLYTALIAAALTLMFATSIGERTQRILLYLDAASISVFAVAGTNRAESFGLAWFPAVLLGVTTAVGGGSLRDVLSGTTPRVFERGTFYAIAAFAATAVYLGLDYLNLPSTICAVAGVVVGFLLRMLSVHFDWTTDALRPGR